MSDSRRCARTNLAETSECKWPAGVEVYWYLDLKTIPASLTSGEAINAITAAAALWNASSGVLLDETGNRDFARVLISFGAIDGPYNVLGDTYLPCGASATSQVTMLLDWSEPWTADYLAQVVLHELGHALGLGHAPDGTIAVMAPIYDPALTTLQPWDLGQVVERYGPVDPATKSWSGTFHLDGAGNVPVTFNFESPAAGDYQVTIVRLTP